MNNSGIAKFYSSFCVTIRCSRNTRRFNNIWLFYALLCSRTGILWKIIPLKGEQKRRCMKSLGNVNKMRSDGRMFDSCLEREWTRMGLVEW